MPSREELHNLIDSLPDGALEAAYRILSAFRSGPSSALDLATIRQRHEEMRMEMRKRMEERLPKRPGTLGGFGGSGSYNPNTGSGSHRLDYWDGDGFVVQTYRQHLGHEIMVIERIRVDGQRLIYKHEISGPGDKRDEREVTFEL